MRPAPGLGSLTVKRYVRAASADDLLRPPKYDATLVDPYREHLRRRLTEEPSVPVTHLLAEIRECDYPGSSEWWAFCGMVCMVPVWSENRRQDAGAMSEPEGIEPIRCAGVVHSAAMSGRR